MADVVLTPTAAALVASGVVAPVIAVIGPQFGLRADLLMGGLAGAVAAMVLLDSVPGTGDSLRELLRTTARRIGVAITSAVLAGYFAPIAALVLQGMLSAALTSMEPAKLAALVLTLERAAGFTLGGAAQRIFKVVINRTVRKAEGQKPEGA